MIRTVLGAVALLGVAGLVAAAIASSDTPATVAGPAAGERPSPAASPASTPADEAASPGAAIPVIGDAPPVTDLDGWLQADGLTDLEDLRGQVVVVQFWTFSCFNCKNTLPNLRALYAEHGDRPDFEVVGIHSPEFDFEKDPEAVARAANDLGVVWPIALDTDKHNFRSWQGNRRFWPRTYVLDREGRIRFDHIGEGAYDELNATVAALLADPGPAPEA